jgi:TPR repeat protein
MKNFKTFFLFFAFLLCSYSTLFAQAKRGEPNLDDLKAEIKKAKDGDIAAMLLVADRCRGAFFVGDELRDYKTAKKWYTEAIEKDAQQKDANLGLFKLYTIGGYGIDKEDELAKQYFRKAIELHNAQAKPLVINFADNLNLDLVNFYSSLEKAQVGVTEDMITLARMYFYYEISMKEATTWAEKAKAQGSKDGAYLLAYWEHIRNNSKNETALLDLQQAHAILGSPMAKMGLLANAKGKNRLKAEEADNFMKELLKNPQIEVKAKATALLSYYTEGKRKITLLRNLQEIVSDDKKEAFFCQDALATLVDFDSKTKTIKGLFAFAEANADMRYLAFSQEEYDKNYAGKIDQLIQIQQIISTPQHSTFLTADNLAAYQAELAQKAVEVVGSVDNISKFVALKKLADTDKWLLSIGNSVQPAMAKKMAELGVTPENLNFFYEKSLMEAKIFKTLEEGKKYYYHIQSVELDNASKDKLLTLLKSKLLNDVFGSNRNAETIEKLRVAANTQGWLLPEVQDRYLALVNENNEWFAGIVDRNEIRYHFIVSRDADIKDPNRYKIEIRGVKNEEAHLVYSGQVLVQDLREKSKEIRCKVFFVINENGTYWRVASNDFLETSFLQGQEYINYKPQGKMTNCIDSAHTTPKDDIAKVMIAYDFSIQNAVKTAIKVMILEFNKVLLPL